jgi:cation transport ATPase
MSIAMSTPVNQIKPSANSANITPPKIDDDPMVQDIINSLVKEAKTPENVRSTPMGTFQQQPEHMQNIEHQQYMMQQQYIQQQQLQQQQQQQYMMHQQQQQQQQQYMQQQPPQPHKKSLYDEWVNYEDAKKVIVIAFIALVLLYPYDTTSLYNKFTTLAPFYQYDIFIRFVLLAVILYIILRKFAYLLDM